MSETRGRRRPGSAEGRSRRDTGDDLFGVGDDDLLDQIGFAKRPEGLRRRRRKQKKNRQVRLLTWIVAVVLVAFAGFFVVKQIAPYVVAFGTGVDDGEYSGPGEGEVLVTVPLGASGTDIGTRLQRADVVKSGATFAKLLALDDGGGQIQPGTYALKRHMNSADALAALRDKNNRRGGMVTIPEGKWKDEIFQTLSQKTSIPVAEFHKVTPAEAGLPDQAGGNLEGWLFPATYPLDKSFTAKDYVRTMVDQTKRTLRSENVPENKWQETLIRASLVQAEGFTNDDFAKVAYSIELRMKSRSRLIQFDSTIHYATKSRGAIYVSTNDTKYQSPYNTYTYPGLPPGPINNPGAAAINGVMHPQEGEYFYFVAVDPCQGITKYTNDFRQHEENRKEYERWLARTGGKCS